MKKLYILLVILKIVCSMPPPPDTKCSTCDTSVCDDTSDCTRGITKNACGCCDVCLRHDGEHCGGLHMREGSCDKNLFCHVRHPNSRKNIFRSEKVGRCEPDACKDVTCGMHQWCTSQGNETYCHCKEECANVSFPVCGLTNGIDYANVCEVRRAECETQIKIAFLPGPCQTCSHDDQTFKHGETLMTSNPCEVKTCRHGNFEETIDKECLKGLGFSCTLGSRKYPDIKCDGISFCKVTVASDTEFPSLGECLKLNSNSCTMDGKTYKVNQTFVSEDCRGQCKCHGLNHFSCVSLCPPTILYCTPDETLVQEPVPMSETPKCHCLRPKCIPNAEICKMKPDAGPCYGYFEKWYYDSKVDKCTTFVFGGCRGNRNNYDTEEDCKRTCQMRIPFISDTDNDEDSEGGDSNKGRSVPKMSTKYITINGHISFTGKEQTLPAGSCLMVFLDDNTLADADAITIAQTEFDLSNYNSKQKFHYLFTSKKPVKDDLRRSFGIYAALHVGWCPKRKETIKIGDYVMDTEYPVALTSEVDSYTEDVVLKCYKCDEEDEDAVMNHGQMPPVVLFDDVPSVSEEDKVEDPHYDLSQRFGDRKMVISGMIKFLHKVGQLPSPSCLRVQLQDVSLMDAKSLMLAYVDINLSGQNIDETLPYRLESKKPAEKYLGMTYSISATLNYGWCRKTGSKEWVRRGDYLTDTHFGVTLSAAKDEYKKDFQIMCYACPANRGLETIDPPVQPARDDPVPIPLENEEGKGGDEEEENSGDEAGEKGGDEAEEKSGDEAEEENGEEAEEKSGDEAEEKSGDEAEEENGEEAEEKSGDEAEEENGEEAEEKSGDEAEEGGEGSFSFSFTPKGPKLTAKSMKIEGIIKFPHRVTLPRPSCLHIKFQDVSLADASAVILARVDIDVSERDIDQEFKYVIISKKPADDEYWRTYSLGAVLNKGWCPTNDSRRWIQPGDYVNDFAHNLKLKKEEDSYKKDIDVICYNCQIEKTAKPETKKPVLDEETKGPKLGNTFMEVFGYIHFNETLGKLPNGSCLTYSFFDNTKQDAPSIRIDGRTEYVGGVEFGDKHKYLLGFNKPEESEFSRDYGVSAILNVGWCPTKDSTEWSRDGDFVDEWSNSIVLTKEMNTYRKNIVLTKMCKSESCLKKKLQTCFDVSVNETFYHGDTWSRDPCTECECLNGLDSCTVIDCLPCENPVYESKTCCPKCIDGPELPKPTTCFDVTVNKTFQEGSKWNRDSCSFCECYKSEVLCAIMDCEEVTCDKPIYIEDQCCATCPPENNTCFDETLQKTFENGERWTTSPCTKCSCSEGKTMCNTLTCDFVCSNPVYTPGECCPECPDTSCVDKGVTYGDGDSWQQGDCGSCFCDGGKVRCAVMDCPMLLCEIPIYEKGQCCPKCLVEELTCVEDGVTYTEGDSWKNGDCTTCKCEGGEMICAVQDCFTPSCKNVKRIPGKCCPVCENPVDRCAVGDRIYKDGDHWVENNGCNHCICMGGMKQCATPACVLPECPNGNITNEDGLCCPVCSISNICKDRKENRVYVEGSIWQEEERCELCKCEATGIKCSPVTKDLTGCRNSVQFNAVCGQVCLDTPISSVSKDEAVDP